MVERVSTVVIPSPTRSLVASRWIQKDTHDRTTIKIQGTYTCKERRSLLSRTPRNRSTKPESRSIPYAFANWTKLEPPKIHLFSQQTEGYSISYVISNNNAQGRKTISNCADAKPKKNHLFNFDELTFTPDKCEIPLRHAYQIELAECHSGHKRDRIFILPFID